MPWLSRKRPPCSTTRQIIRESSTPRLRPPLTALSTTVGHLSQKARSTVTATYQLRSHPALCPSPIPSPLSCHLPCLELRSRASLAPRTTPSMLRSILTRLFRLAVVHRLMKPGRHPSTRRLRSWPRDRHRQTTVSYACVLAVRGCLVMTRSKSVAPTPYLGTLQRTALQVCHPPSSHPRLCHRSTGRHTSLCRHMAGYTQRQASPQCRTTISRMRAHLNSFNTCLLSVTMPLAPASPSNDHRQRRSIR